MDQFQCLMTNSYYLMFWWPTYRSDSKRVVVGYYSHSGKLFLNAVAWQVTLEHRLAKNYLIYNWLYNNIY